MVGIVNVALFATFFMYVFHLMKHLLMKRPFNYRAHFFIFCIQISHDIGHSGFLKLILLNCVVHLHVAGAHVEEDLFVKLLLMQFKVVFVLALERKLELTIGFGDQRRQLLKLLTRHNLRPKRRMLRQRSLEPLQSLLLFCRVIVPEEFGFLRTYLNLIIFLQFGSGLVAGNTAL